MNGHVKERLESLSAEMDGLRTELAILAEQREMQGQAMDRRKAQMLVAETPLADHEYRLARQAHDQIVQRLGEIEAALAALTDERDRLLDLLGKKAERRAG
jgi:chromosome segregation ATPase